MSNDLGILNHIPEQCLNISALRKFDAAKRPFSVSYAY